MTLTEFLLARIAEDEASLKSATDYDCWNGVGRELAECEAKRRIVELHRSWPVLVETPLTVTTTSENLGVNSMTFRASQQIQWFTQEEYRKRFGSEPPTAPMLAAMSAVYADHPDYREEWRVS